MLLAISDLQLFHAVNWEQTREAVGGMHLLVAVLVAGVVLLATWTFQLYQRKDASFINSFTGIHVVVTGGSSGIGFAIAKKALMEGAYVTLIGRTTSNLDLARETLLRECAAGEDRVLFQALDVSDQKAVAASVREIFKRRPIDVLVCNAGVAPMGFIETYSVEALDEIVRTNLMGCIYPVHAVLPLMKQRDQVHPSSIVFISSLAGLFVAYGSSIYTATKHAQRGLAEALRLELIPYNIRVNLICPGYTETPMLDVVDRSKEIADTLRLISVYKRERATSADYVAECTMRAVKKGVFLTSMGCEGFISVVVARGYIPSESILVVILECLLFIPIRLWTLFFERKLWNALATRYQPTTRYTTTT